MEFPIFVSCKDKTAIAYHLPIWGIKKAPRANSELFVLMFKCDYLIFNLAFISADKAFLFI